VSRTAVNRTKYNAARPFRVIGGVSDNEVAMLQAARGPLAKVSVVSMWLQEFINREYLAGSMGNVASPIISRLHQYMSDGMLGYNQARKVAYVPFPFVHAQLTSFFVLIVVGFMPILMLAFINNSVFGFFLNILTVMCFTGLHEVSWLFGCVAVLMYRMPIVRQTHPTKSIRS
jgi:VIT1/CCC1 family predicted Fe2+/Mn2+ transporter